MNTNVIRERLAEETKSFCLRLSDGRTLPVPHPDVIAVGQNVILVIGENDKVSRVDPHHVVSIEEGPQQSNGPSN
ncbi:MAG: hypothetical protein HY735_06450 [Verrucomicrobia bacterium]|nr:hypothetical protein [Verrucomicrobiota bacterium]